MKENKAYTELCKRILKEVKKRKISDQDKFNKIKMQLVKGSGIKTIPKNTDIINVASRDERKKLSFILSMKPIRTLAGVSVVAIMTKPMPCPHGKCIYCPGGVDSHFGNVPQSYTGKEPTTRRAIRNNYDPYLQVFNRLEQYVVTNKIPDKVEIIVMGGTFPSYPKDYQEEFVRYTFKAMNDFSNMFFKKGELNIAKFLAFFELPGDIDDERRHVSIMKKALKIKSKGKNSLEKEQSKNEKAMIRCVGLTIETKPDYATLEHANQMLKLGATRVELGVQTVYNDVLQSINRGHTIEDTVDSTATLKDLGFKINYQMMPGLPGVTLKKDYDGLTALFKEERFQPDMLKIYPCMVLKGTKLYDMWKKKKYTPLTTKQAAELIARFKETVPEYVRIMRVQRDIPTYATEAGVDKTNLRQYIDHLMKNKGKKCRCIRCREVGRNKGKIGKPVIAITHYRASKGNEFFISVEYCDFILGFCRVRFPHETLRKEITNDSALIRELHVYGLAVPIGKKDEDSMQHKGLGKRLVKIAEEISKEYYKKKVVVISGIGAREYYKKLGYKREGPYMVKRLK